MEGVEVAGGDGGAATVVEPPPAAASEGDGDFAAEAARHSGRMKVLYEALGIALQKVGKDTTYSKLVAKHPAMLPSADQPEANTFQQLLEQIHRGLRVGVHNELLQFAQDGYDLPGGLARLDKLHEQQGSTSEAGKAEGARRRLRDATGASSAAEHAMAAVRQEHVAQLREQVMQAEASNKALSSQLQAARDELLAARQALTGLDDLTTTATALNHGILHPDTLTRVEEFVVAAAPPET
eukprot:m.65437 g.65437  ORF g.65437 m.65437 type:complete len:239 (+) comp13665_c0_seq1:174-890(+)